MSDTPKTDEREKVYWETPTSHVDDVWQFARELERENVALRKVISDADVVTEYNRNDGRREWWDGGYWLHKGEALVCIDLDTFDKISKEGQS